MKKRKHKQNKHMWFSNENNSLHINHYLKSDFDGKNPTNVEKGNGRQKNHFYFKQCVFNENPYAGMQNTQNNEKQTPFSFPMKNKSLHINHYLKNDFDGQTRRILKLRS